MPTPLKFVSLNIACGTGSWDGPGDRAWQNQYLAGLFPDVVGMQEVEVGVTRSGGGDTALQSTATMLGTRAFARAASTNMAGGYLVGGAGAIGNALWVRAGLTIADSWTVPLDYADPPNSDGWPRCALIARVTGEGHDFTVAVCHLLTGDSVYANQRRAREVQETAAYGPDVILGDFNALGDEIALSMPPAFHLASNPDYPGCIDQIWARWDSTGKLVPTKNASDHPYAAFATVSVP